MPNQERNSGSARVEARKERTLVKDGGSAGAPRETGIGILIPAFEGRDADGVRRDSLGRGLDDKSIVAAVDGNADVQRERADRTIYVQTAYRNPKAATERLDMIIANDGATSAARRVSSDPVQLGELRGREGFFAGAKSKEERETALLSAAAIGPNVSRAAEAESRAALAYRGEVEKQMKADATAVPDLSDRAKAALGAVAAAKDDKTKAGAWRKIEADKDVRREVEAFTNAAKTRFGEDGARGMLRAESAGKPFEHHSVPRDSQSSLAQTSRLFATVRGGDQAASRATEAENLAMRQTQGARLKP